MFTIQRNASAKIFGHEIYRGPESNAKIVSTGIKVALVLATIPLAVSTGCLIDSLQRGLSLGPEAMLDMVSFAATLLLCSVWVIVSVPSIVLPAALLAPGTILGVGLIILSATTFFNTSVTPLSWQARLLSFSW